MKKRIRQNSKHFISGVARLGAAAVIAAGLIPFAAFGASCKNEGNWREKGSLFDPSFKVTIRARAADAGDGWKVQTRSYFTKVGEKGDYGAAIETDSSSIGLSAAGDSVLWRAKALELNYNDTNNVTAALNQFRVDLAAGNGSTVACFVTLKGKESGDVDKKAKFDGVECTANGSAIEDLDKNNYVSCTRSFKDAANRFEVVLTLLD
jgi:hypothetical protein